MAMRIIDMTVGAGLRACQGVIACKRFHSAAARSTIGPLRRRDASTWNS